VRIELDVPGPSIVVSHQHDAGNERAEVLIAVRDAFAAARREIEGTRMGDREPSGKHHGSLG
jgi:hypothetical protein